MKKDIIYIDVEDDITAIIGKVKASKEAIIALVPPKRIGVLQSAVNLRLLQRAASQNDKRIVLITGNQALVGLAAAASIPVARNLQSKPELAEVPVLEVDNGEDVIDGAELPVGEHAKQAKSLREAGDDSEAELIQGVDVEREPSVTPPAFKRPSGKLPSKKKVPNFTTFRKRLVLIIGAAILLIGGLIWALVFAPAATVIITARTTAAPVSDVVTFGKDTNAEQGTIQAVTESIEKEATVDFEATGKKDVGEKATGTVRFTSDSFSALAQGISIPEGTTVISSGGKEFTTDRAVQLSLSGNSDSVAVTAAERGESYNDATGAVSGSEIPSTVNGSFVDATSGGTSKTVPIVTAADVQAAKEKLVKQSTDEVKQELTGKFASTAKVIEASFNVDYQDVTSEPAIGDEAENKKATLTSKVVYTLSAIEGTVLDAYLDQTLKQQMQDQTAQKIYDNGADDIKLNDYTKNGKTQSVRLVATGQIGPTINEDEVKQRVAGKRFGEIQSDLTTINGVSDVKVKFSFFWVSTVPNNPDKIKIEFDVQNAGQ